MSFYMCVCVSINACLYIGMCMCVCVYVHIYEQFSMCVGIYALVIRLYVYARQ